jgi:hypothetical protein
MLATTAAVTRSAPAKADTIYDFVPTVTLGSSGQSIEPFTLQLDLSNSFTPESISRNCDFGMCYSQSGNFSDFSLSATIGTFHLATLNNEPDYVFEETYGTFDGSSGTLFWGTDSSITLTLTFGNGVWNAVFNSDYAPLGLGAGYCAGTGCTAYGTVSQVPEPASSGLFTTSLVAFAAALGFRLTARKRKTVALS